jgi:hypothetical protein
MDFPVWRRVAIPPPKHSESRRNENPVPPCHWAIGPPGWGFDAKPTTLRSKNNIVAKSKEVRKPDAILQNLLRSAVAQKGAVLPMWGVDDKCMDLNRSIS